jgi:hypothetical protein
MRRMTPGELALADRALAACDGEVTGMVAAFRDRAAETGTEIATLEMAAAFAHRAAHGEHGEYRGLAALCAAAIARVARIEDSR